MKRRTLLGAVAGVLTAGCTSSNGGSSPGGGSGGGSSTTARPSVASSSLSVGAVSCGSASDSASVSWGDGAVSIDGVLPVPSPCYAPKLAAASYDSSADALSVVVAQTQSTEVCVQCLADAHYSARVEFDGGLPGTVAVTHRSKGGSRVVTSASR